MKQSKGLKRNAIDKFYTKKEITKLCYNIIKKTININKEKDLIIEPSAGNGSFIDVVKSLSYNNIFYDIKPEHNSIIEQDYLKLENNFKYNNIHIIGNPPFGRQSSLALKFIKHSATFCRTISFILPRSFKKQSMKDKIPLNFHCISEIDLPEKSFLLNDKNYDVPCIFQIWEKRDIKREKTKKLKPTKYKFIKKDQNPDISFRRVGVYAGKIEQKIENKSSQSHYFIKFDSFNDILFDKLKLIEFKESSYTVGPKSISKQELIREYNKIIL